MKEYNVIGLMSGTSQDGLDIAFCSFSFTEEWSFKIKVAETISYPKDIHLLLQEAFYSDTIDLESKSKVYGKFIGEQVNAFCEKHNINPNFIASHGHTVFHKPNEGVTVQIGDGETISRVCGLPVVYDFRIQDVVLGGQGAPLVPIGDRLLFNEYDCCVNIGGFSNISFDEIKDGKKLRRASNCLKTPPYPIKRLQHHNCRINIIPIKKNHFFMLNNLAISLIISIFAL